MSAQSIGSLTNRLAAGEDEAFCEFHVLYFDRLFRHLLAQTGGDEEEAKEALQETFIRVAKYVRRFESEEVFWCWLCAVARSARRDHGRKRRRYEELLRRYVLRWLPVQSEPSPSSFEDVLQSVFDRCLAELAPDDRALLEEKYRARTSVKELAVKTGQTEKSVESRLLRLRRHLRERLIKSLSTTDDEK